MYGEEKNQPLFPSDYSKQKYCDYLGKQASHITKYGWGVSNGENLLNIDPKKILPGVFVCVFFWLVG